MRCIYGPKKVKKFREKFNLPIMGVMCRGGTGHRVDLLLEDFTITYLWPDGTLQKSKDRWGAADLDEKKEAPRVIGLLQYRPFSRKERLSYECSIRSMM
jgi:hypothetical protein